MAVKPVTKQAIKFRGKPIGFRRAGEPRINQADLVVLTVAGQIAHPVSKSSPYRVGQDGIPRILPGTGGIVINYRIGDRCVGLQADHVEPGVSIKNYVRSSGTDKDGENLALNTYACVGNIATVLDGPCKDKKGLVTGKHGGVNHVLIDFPEKVLRTLRIGDKIQINSYGVGLRLLDHSEITVWNCDPRLLSKWGVQSKPPKLYVPVSHMIPAGLMGSGLGRSNALRGDYDIQLSNPEINRRLKLNTLRFGDFVAIIDADTRYGRSFQKGFITIGIVVHSDSTVSGHGPGVVTLFSGESRFIQPQKDNQANLAIVMGIKELPRPVAQKTLLQKDRKCLKRRLDQL
jgi:Domain of unknown function (DUF4438), N-terminal/Domain of unknown function (DUF4438), C-terminal